MRIFLLSIFLIWTPLVLSNPVYIKINNDDIPAYHVAGRKVSVDECWRHVSGKLNAIIKIDLDKQLATVAVGAIKNKKYTYATVWNHPSDIQNDTKVRFENLEESVNIFEQSSEFSREATFKIDRTTLAGEAKNPFILGVCRNHGSGGFIYYDTLRWQKGEIIEEEEYKQLFKIIKLKDDEITKNFEIRKKEKEKEDAEKARKKF